MKDTMDENKSVIVHLPRLLLPHDENGKVNLIEKEKLILNWVIKTDKVNKIITIEITDLKIKNAINQQKNESST